MTFMSALYRAGLASPWYHNLMAHGGTFRRKKSDDVLPPIEAFLSRGAVVSGFTFFMVLSLLAMMYHNSVGLIIISFFLGLVLRPIKRRRSCSSGYDPAKVELQMVAVLTVIHFCFAVVSVYLNWVLVGYSLKGIYDVPVADLNTGGVKVGEQISEL